MNDTPSAQPVQPTPTAASVPPSPPYITPEAADNRLLAEILGAVLTLQTKTENSHKELDDKLNQHMIDESLEISTTGRAVEQINSSLEVLQSMMSTQAAQMASLVGTYNDLEHKTTSIEGAFVKREDGAIDFSGHYEEHNEKATTRKRWRARVEKWKDDIGGKVLTVILVFFALAIFDRFKWLISMPGITQ